MARSAAARKLLADLDAELAAASQRLGKRLVWTAQERSILDDISSTQDRIVRLRREWSRADDVKVLSKLSAELRLLETSKARLLKQVTPDVPATPSLKTVKARKAAQQRWKRDGAADA